MRLYLHWPFCLSRCAYCDFNTRVAGKEVMREYHKAIVAEIHAWSCLLAGAEGPLRSLYLGGGTPSTLSGEGVASLVGEAVSRFGIHDGAEMTVEVNPATWSRRDFADACAGGVNRFSIGMQSSDDDILRLLGRAHSSEEAANAVREALHSGADSVSVDLIYGLPGMDEGSLKRTLQEALELHSPHLSLYALTLEEKSPLARRASRGELILPDEEAVANQYMVASSLLQAAGYERYEISNFCMPGHHSRHNLAYWRREEYLGVGAGAHSLLGKCRFNNSSSLLAYMNRLRRGHMAVESAEMLAFEDEREEEIMLGLRTSHGIAQQLVRDGRGHLEELERGGFLTRRGGRVRLTTQGILVSNTVIATLLAA